jgi:hypothetical protein
VKYPNGDVARLGDRVRLWYGEPGKPDAEGEVVCSIDTDEYLPSYPRDEWAYLGKGILVLSPQAGLIHYIEPEPRMELLERKTA